MLTIPLSRMTQIKQALTQKPYTSQRYGQLIHDLLELDKSNDPEVKVWADRLYNADDAEAKRMIAEVIDPNN